VVALENHELARVWAGRMEVLGRNGLRHKRTPGRQLLLLDTPAPTNRVISSSDCPIAVMVSGDTRRAVVREVADSFGLPTGLVAERTSRQRGTDQQHTDFFRHQNQDHPFSSDAAVLDVGVYSPSSRGSCD
jgi:hypothetical protein